MDVATAIRQRYTHRGAFQDRKIDRDILLQLITSAGWAPSGHNSQPWEFIIIDDKKTIHDLIMMAAEKFLGFQKTRPDFKQWVDQWRQFLRWSDAELEKAGDGMYLPQTPRGLWEELFAGPISRELQAKAIDTLYPKDRFLIYTSTPCLIFTLLDTSRKIPNPSHGIMEMTSIGAAVQNLRLTAHALGLGTHEFSLLYDLPPVREEIIKRLGIPGHLKIVSVMRTGYPASQGGSHHTRIRKPAEEKAHWNRF